MLGPIDLSVLLLRPASAIAPSINVHVGNTPSDINSISARRITATPKTTSSKPQGMTLTPSADLDFQSDRFGTLRAAQCCQRAEPSQRSTEPSQTLGSARLGDRNTRLGLNSARHRARNLWLGQLGIIRR